MCSLFTGVNLWNVSGQIRGNANDDASKTVFAARMLVASSPSVISHMSLPLTPTYRRKK